MVKIGFEDVGKYDKATFVCLQHSDLEDTINFVTGIPVTITNSLRKS